MSEAIERFLRRLGIATPAEALFDAPDRQRTSAQCYLESDGRLLMLHRHKEPFAGYWTVPGGKLVAGEDPEDAVVRELKEETGLSLIGPRLVVITSELGGPEYDWLLFIFHCTRYAGELRPSDEGELAWVSRSDLFQMTVPDVDRRIWPFVFRTEPARRPVHVRVRYDAAHAVAHFEATELR